MKKIAQKVHTKKKPLQQQYYIKKLTPIYIKCLTTLISAKIILLTLVDIEKKVTEIEPNQLASSSNSCRKYTFEQLFEYNKYLQLRIILLFSRKCNLFIIKNTLI